MRTEMLYVSIQIPYAGNEQTLGSRPYNGFTGGSRIERLQSGRALRGRVGLCIVCAKLFEPSQDGLLLQV
ncbi:MAG TPA: hypothetical protein VG498_23760 [Terriglobales bacterium]|nr:hypothetical protein [Terriglobales bacterium]